MKMIRICENHVYDGEPGLFHANNISSDQYDQNQTQNWDIGVCRLFSAYLKHLSVLPHVAVNQSGKPLIKNELVFLVI